MKRTHRIGLAALAVALAATAAWRVRAHLSPPPPRAPAAAEAGHGHAHGHDEGHTPIDEPELREGPGRVLAEPEPVGEQRLAGQVLDGAGRPVAGATIWLGSTPPRHTSSGADGSFSFEGLPWRAYPVAAQAPGGVAGPLTGHVDAPLLLRLGAGGRLEVELVDAQQQAVPAATVELRGLAEQQAEARAGRASLTSVVPGVYQVVATADGYARAAALATVGAGTAALRLELARGAPVSGRVLDESGTPVAGARVRYDGAADFGPGATAGGYRDAVTTGADGAFTFATLPAGSLRFLAYHPEHAIGISPLVALDGRTAKTGLEVTLPRGATVAGTVVDARGEPVVGARVRVGIAASGFRASAPPREVSTDGMGAFVVRGVPRRELSAVALTDAASSSAVAIDAASGEVRQVRLVLDSTLELAGQVLDAAGQPAAGAQVLAVPDLFARRRGGAAPTGGPAGGVAQWQLRGFPQGLTDAGGRFRLAGLPAGAYRVSAVRGAALGRGRRGLLEVLARAGADAVTVALPVEGGLRGQVVFADGTSPARFTVALGLAQRVFTGGALSLESLPPQRYQLVLRGATFATRVIEAAVEPGKITDLGRIEVVAGRQLGGVVLAAGKPVAGATVVAGARLRGSGTALDDASVGGVVRAQSGADGTFSLPSVSAAEVVVVADHPEHGRSQPLVWGAGSGQDVVRLLLAPTGSVRGRVTLAGEAVAGLAVVAQPLAAASVSAHGVTARDGSYRFERLAAGVYKISARSGSPPAEVRETSRQLEVVAGREILADVAVTRGAVTLEVQVTAASGELGWLGFAQAPGRLHATDAHALEAQLATSSGGASQYGVTHAPLLRLSELSPGPATVCVVAYPRELQQPEQLAAYAERHGATLAAQCVFVEVQARPARQALAISVTVPPLAGRP